MGYPLPNKYTLLSNAVATGAGEWVKLPLHKAFEYKGIGTATVKIQYRLHPDGAVQELDSVTADGVHFDAQALYEVRANVTVYSSGTISVYACAIESS